MISTNKKAETDVNPGTQDLDQCLTHVLRAIGIYPDKNGFHLKQQGSYAISTVETHGAQLFPGFVALGSHLTPLALVTSFGKGPQWGSSMEGKRDAPNGALDNVFLFNVQFCWGLTHIWSNLHI